MEITPQKSLNKAAPLLTHLFMGSLPKGRNKDEILEEDVAPRKKEGGYDKQNP